MIPKITDEMKQEMKTLFVKGMVPCEEIARRMDISRQSVALAMKKLGVNTAKRRFVVECSECKNPVEKTRAEVRRFENHFCSIECYKAWMQRPEVHEEAQNMKILTEKASNFVSLGYNGEGIKVFSDGNDIYVFGSREIMLEWKRTGLPGTAISVNTGKVVTITYEKGTVCVK